MFAFNDASSDVPLKTPVKLPEFLPYAIPLVEPVVFGLSPNIIGFLNSYGLGNVPNDFNIHWDGALTLVSLQEQSLVQINEDPQWKTTQDFRFDASKSNGTYSGNLVQPKALNALPCIKF